MDTVTHCLSGAAVVTIAAVDPEITRDHLSLILLLIAAVIVSNIPDIDVIFSKNKKFLALHRGFTHGFPIVIVMTTIIGFAFCFPIVQHITWWKYALILLGCSLLHLLMDISNHYGTQILYPFSEKWFAHSFISTFDPFIFVLVLTYPGIYLTQFWLNYQLFSWLQLSTVFFSIIGSYYLIKYLWKKILTYKIRKIHPKAHNVVMVTMFTPGHYRYVVETLDRFYIGAIYGLKIKQKDISNKHGPLDAKILRLLNKSPEVKAFRYFSPVYKIRTQSLDEFNKIIILIDLRYFTPHNHQPLQVRVKVNLKNLTISPTHNGFQYNPKKIYKKELLSLK